MEKTIFYRGVVEDNNDPKKMGRVLVRIFGIHGKNIEDSPTDTLEWCEVAVPVAFGGISGIGVSSIPVKGTYVWCFLDGDDERFPVVFACSPGVSTAQEEGAFTDPDKKYPLQDRLNEPDFNRIGRVEKVTETPVEQAQKRQRLTFINQTKNGEETFVDKAKYPFCHVIETQAHHTIIIDDTEGNENIKVFHPKGSYAEIRPDGTILVKSVKDKITIVENDESHYINNNHDVSIGGNHTRSIGGDSIENIGGNLKTDIGGTENRNVGSSSTTKAGGTYKVTAPMIELN